MDIKQLLDYNPLMALLDKCLFASRGMNALFPSRVLVNHSSNSFIRRCAPRSALLQGNNTAQCRPCVSGELAQIP